MLTTTRLTTYYRVWLLTAQNALQIAFVNRGTNSLFMLGKMVRLIMSVVFLLLLRQRNISIGEYAPSQVIVFFITYQFIDSLAQVFYRGVYEFGGLIRSGEFDGLLSKPINALFRALTGKPDINDALFLIPTTVLSIGLIMFLDISITLSSGIWYLLLLGNSFLIATALHILVLAFGVVTTEVDNLIWTYRDLTRLGQFPVTMYHEPLRTALFLVLPIGLMFTIPSQVLLGSQPTYSIALTSLGGILFFLFSLQIWKWAIKNYTSASS